MGTFSKTLTDVNELALEKAAEAYNASNDLSLGKPDNFVPLAPHEYLSHEIDRLLKRFQDDHLRIPSGDFVLRFTPAEIGAIMAARQQSPQLDAYLTELTAAPLVYTGSALVRAGMASLVQAGLITQARHDEILDI